MRIIKLGTGEFSNLEEVENYFENVLPYRNPPGKFLIPSPLIGKSGLNEGEELLFAFQGTIYFSALAASERMDNQDRRTKRDYPFYFLIDLHSLKRLRISLSEIENILAQNDITMSIVKSRSWPMIEDQNATHQIWRLTGSRNLSRNETSRKKYGTGGEGIEHKRLKEWVANNPRSVGIKNVRSTKVEHSYLSGDSVDILFELTTNTDVVIEIETIDPLPGCHQAIKYRALRCAERGLPLSSDEVQAMIVAWEIPVHVMEFCEKYNIRHVEKRI